MKTNSAIYLDYNATTPIDPEVRQAMEPYLYRQFGNPSSLYSFGRKAKQAVEQARADVAALLCCEPEEIVFTSGGSESNNYAIKGIAHARKAQGKHIITSAIEHPAVSEVCRFLERIGFRISVVPVSKLGIIDLAALREQLSKDTVLISIMHANNEVGSVQPVDKVGEIARTQGIAFHSDAAQSVGKIPTDVDALKVDLLSLAGHKLYAPKGVGALYIRRGTVLEKLIHGAGQEMGLRAGTENVLEIVGLGKACEIALRDAEKTSNQLREMRQRLYQGLLQGVPDLYVHANSEKGLPNTLSVSFPKVCAAELLEKIKAEVAASAGSACHSDRVIISPVLEAMGVAEELALGTVRFSTGRYTTAEEVDEVVSVVINTVSQLRKSGLSSFARRVAAMVGKGK